MSFGSKPSNGSFCIKPLERDFLISFFSSTIDPITIVSFESDDFQIGRGIPQNLDLDRFQSLALASQFPNLPSPVDFGFQLIVLLSSTSLSFLSVTFINQESKG